MSILEIRNINKAYSSGASLFGTQNKTVACNNVSFDIKKGESFGLVGESGSGKSTLANIIAGLVKADSGEVIFKGEDILKYNRKKQRLLYKDLQMVFQDPYSTLNPKRTIGWSAGETLRNFKEHSEEEIKELVIEALRDVDLDASYYDRYPHNLSGGQRQRVAIASAVITRPAFIIIDEGVSALDVSIQAAILNLLNELKDKYELTYLFISHDLNVIEYFCDRIAVMYQGDLIEVFDPLQIPVEERAPYTKKLFAAIPDIYLQEGE